MGENEINRLRLKLAACEKRYKAAEIKLEALQGDFKGFDALMRSEAARNEVRAAITGAIALDGDGTRAFDAATEAVLESLRAMIITPPKRDA